MGAELINLRRARKARTRAEKAREAEANRVEHGTPKSAHDLAKARADKALHDLDAQRLDKDEA
jgi:Domain of unknown function (DUF4169)